MTDAFPWFLFHILIVIALWIDLRTSAEFKGKKGIQFALWASFAWVVLALFFGAWIWRIKGDAAGADYVTAYLIERALSMDNLFVFVVLFKMFCTPEEYQRKVLFWGVLGAVIMRAVFIFLGIALVDRFFWILYIFAVMLFLLAYRLLFKNTANEIPSMVKFLQRWFPISKEYAGDAWFVKMDGRWFATPLLMTLISIEITDVIFAIDSIPAVMGITLDPLVIYTSNIFAVLGLRALYFVMSALIEAFYYLNQGLAIILVFIAIKILIKGYYDISHAFSLIFVISVLIICAVASIWKRRIK